MMEISGPSPEAAKLEAFAAFCNDDKIQKNAHAFYIEATSQMYREMMGKEMPNGVQISFEPEKIFKFEAYVFGVMVRLGGQLMLFSKQNSMDMDEFFKFIRHGIASSYGLFSNNLVNDIAEDEEKK